MLAGIGGEAITLDSHKAREVRMRAHSEPDQPRCQYFFWQAHSFFVRENVCLSLTLSTSLVKEISIPIYSLLVPSAASRQSKDDQVVVLPPTFHL